MADTDSQIQKDVMDELRWQPFLNASEIGVSVKDGIVTLSGTVNNYTKKKIAEKVVQNIKGVKAVAEDIIVKYPNSQIKTDAEIAEAVIYTLKWNSYIPDDTIKIKVEDGWITLEGEVEWEFQRNGASRAVRDITGVCGISNLLTISPGVNNNEVKQAIRSALHRSATIDANHIQVEVQGHKVILTGKVRSIAEKKDAGNAAWNTPGITIVDNKLELDSKL